jgi:hypothetical protein
MTPGLNFSFPTPTAQARGVEGEDCGTDGGAGHGKRTTKPKTARLQNRGLQVRVLPALSRMN